MSNQEMGTKDLDRWLALLEEHLSRYPAMEARDVYKLLYQGVLGPEHIMPSSEIFSARLIDELASLDPDPSQPLLESIRPNENLNRINLRSWLATGRDINWLVDTCLETGKLSWGTLPELKQLWQAFSAQVESGQFSTISADQVRALSSWLEEHNYPPAHHSSIYAARYKPAYRLIGFLPDSMGDPKPR
jgi:hypothetical protein